MITRIEARNYRCFQSLDQELGPFHVLVGPNGSGKSTFLDIVSFLGTFVSEGLKVAVANRTANFQDLVFGRVGDCFQLAIESMVPSEHARTSKSTIRYELEIKIDAESHTAGVERECLSARADHEDPVPVITRSERKARLFSAVESYTFDFNRQISALANLPSDSSRFPEAVWFRSFLAEGVQAVELDNTMLRKPGAPYLGRMPGMIDGSSLGRFVSELQELRPQSFSDWLKHVQTSLPEIESIRSILRSEDILRYPMLKYKNGVEVPSWVVSDGTLRLLALTILAYLPEFNGIYLIEEPENGVHPTALETIYQSLSSVYNGQVLVTSHSPILLSLAKPEQLLCFQKRESGVSIVRGDKHPVLQNWKGEVSMSDLLVSGVLG